MENSIRELQLKLLEIMKVVHNVCERNNIKYYMLGGTMLGAIRHKGFIPWDDDMDIGLPREDYEKLLALPTSEWPGNIHIKTPNNSKDLIFPHSKIMNINTTLVEDRLDGIVEGIYIDIFPLDGAGDSKLSAKIKYHIHYFNQGLLFYNQDYGAKRNVLRRLLQRYARKQNVHKLYKNVEKWMMQSNFYSSSIIGNYCGNWGFKEFLDRDIMGIPKLYQFEDSEFYGSENADKYLTSLYGDYMKLPPKENRVSHHKFLYVNLNQPYSEYKNVHANIKSRSLY